MTISTLLMILALTVGSGTSDSTSTTSSTRPVGKIAGNCYINGVWYNPCPLPDPDPGPEPTPEIMY